MIIINVTITFTLMTDIIRGSRLRSAAGVCCHGLPLTHWQSHSHATEEHLTKVVMLIKMMTTKRDCGSVCNIDAAAVGHLSCS